MPKRYVLFTSLSYAYSIFRPLQKAIKQRGDEVAWFLEEGCPDLLDDDEKRLHTIKDVIEYDPLAIFACGNLIYHFLPGIKVSVFHGYPISKRGEKSQAKDDHFAIRGWFDMYCTQGPSSTEYFKTLEQKHGYFKVYETGWCKVDPYFAPYEKQSDKPTILYATTFSKGISSAPLLLDTITALAKTRDWQWRLTFHPKIKDQELLARYRQLASEQNNVEYIDNVRLEDFQQADVMLCDSSSIILEFMLMDKPVVTLRNTNPGPHLLDVNDPQEVEGALETALTRSEALLKQVQDFANHHEAHRDGHNCERILDAVDDFYVHHRNTIKTKPANLLRKFKLRKKLGYWK
ncbi:UDP-N-acetylglucosamine 2-epimerase [Alteromonas lipolytica]|uniref:CDP-glycerol glycerophosphotransferase n=1 Tax=Alteromonas lipolytica TaxID=1856405 RepID=A0A1E8FA96_9ALTE|nr:UDP-N-acetylglucosamine 2-epimerase [Alteromonas lipolytica]OFI32844.1 CDP-glycerol glycerophosphotransferase [Alteromonas lipolytica]GGF64836.1 CDP-glycerol--glycerophosphate glycerophosphotransferase [Alteromonas lipolytica]